VYDSFTLNVCNKRFRFVLKSSKLSLFRVNSITSIKQLGEKYRVSDEKKTTLHRFSMHHILCSIYNGISRQRNNAFFDPIFIYFFFNALQNLLVFFNVDAVFFLSNYNNTLRSFSYIYITKTIGRLFYMWLARFTA